MVTRSLHILHFSSQSQDSERLFDSDMNKLKRETSDDPPEIITLTELSNNARKADAKQWARSNGYRGITFPGGFESDAGFMVKNGIRVMDQGVVSTGRGHRQRGDTKSRNLSWIKVMWNEQVLYFHTLHWFVTGGMPANRAVVNNQTTVLVTQMRKHAQHGAYCFYSGDMNEDDDPHGQTRTKLNAIMANGGIASAWDERHTYPATMGLQGRTLDVIGRDMKNSRMKNTRVKLHRGMNSDHAALSAWYDLQIGVTPPRTTPGRGGQDWRPSGGDQSGNQSHDDIYATGGNVSWKDYRDGTIYPLRQATDDSDTTNG